jgi:hypothetical protein
LTYQRIRGGDGSRGVIAVARVARALGVVSNQGGISKQAGAGIGYSPAMTGAWMRSQANVGDVESMRPIRRNCVTGQGNVAAAQIESATRCVTSMPKSEMKRKATLSAIS